MRAGDGCATCAASVLDSRSEDISDRSSLPPHCTHSHPDGLLPQTFDRMGLLAVNLAGLMACHPAGCSPRPIFIPTVSSSRPFPHPERSSRPRPEAITASEIG